MARRQMARKGNLLGGEQAKWKWPQGLGQQQDPAKKPVTNQIKSSPVTDQKPTCTKCGKHHSGECPKGSGVCFLCRKLGHYSKECPSASALSDHTKALARVFAMTKEEVTVDSLVVSGKLIVHGTIAHALMNSWAMHSFASPTYMRRLGRPFERNS